MKKTIEKDRRMELFMEEKDMNQKKKPDGPAEQEDRNEKVRSGPRRDRLPDIRCPDNSDRLCDLKSSILYMEDGSGSCSDHCVGGAVLFAFVTNKWWVFESHTLNPGKVWREFVSFVLCRVATFLFNLAALFVMVDLMKMEFFLCKLLISVVVVVLNYVFSKILIFTNDKKK